MNVHDLLSLVHSLNEKRHNVFRVGENSKEGQEYRVSLETSLEILMRARESEVQGEAAEQLAECMLRTVYLWTQHWKNHVILLGNSISKEKFVDAFGERVFPEAEERLINSNPMAEKLLDPMWVEREESSYIGGSSWF